MTFLSLAEEDEDFYDNEDIKHKQEKNNKDDRQEDSNDGILQHGDDKDQTAHSDSTTSIARPATVVGQHTVKTDSGSHLSTDVTVDDDVDCVIAADINGWENNGIGEERSADYERSAHAPPSGGSAHYSSPVKDDRRQDEKAGDTWRHHEAGSVINSIGGQADSQPHTSDVSTCASQEQQQQAVEVGSGIYIQQQQAVATNGPQGNSDISSGFAGPTTVISSSGQFSPKAHTTGESSDSNRQTVAGAPHTDINGFSPEATGGNDVNKNGENAACLDNAGTSQPWWGRDTACRDEGNSWDGDDRHDFEHVNVSEAAQEEVSGRSEEEREKERWIEQESEKKKKEEQQLKNEEEQKRREEEELEEERRRAEEEEERRRAQEEQERSRAEEEEERRRAEEEEERRRAEEEGERRRAEEEEERRRAEEGRRRAEEEEERRRAEEEEERRRAEEEAQELEKKQLMKEARLVELRSGLEKRLVSLDLVRSDSVPTFTPDNGDGCLMSLLGRMQSLIKLSLLPGKNLLIAPKQLQFKKCHQHYFPAI
jgi:hypothetical protein